MIENVAASHFRIKPSSSHNSCCLQGLLAQLEEVLVFNQILCSKPWRMTSIVDQVCTFLGHVSACGVPRDATILCKMLISSFCCGQARVPVVGMAGPAIISSFRLPDLSARLQESTSWRILTGYWRRLDWRCQGNAAPDGQSLSLS